MCLSIACSTCDEPPTCGRYDAETSLRVGDTVTPPGSYVRRSSPSSIVVPWPSLARAVTSNVVPASESSSRDAPSDLRLIERQRDHEHPEQQYRTDQPGDRASSLIPAC